MNTLVPSAPPSVTAFFREVLMPLFPESMHAEMERDIPTIGLLLYQLGVNVMVAEQQGIRFSEAVKKPDYLFMGRVYFGASNLLQWQLPAQMRELLRKALSGLVQSKLESMDRLLFAIASRKNDPEAALWRFLLWVAIRVNLLVLTWDNPGVQARGSLDEATDDAETALRGLLDLAGGELQEADCRPLHVLMAETLFNLYHHDRATIQALNHFKEAIEEISMTEDALEAVRGLEAADAAVFQPGASDVELGSQQIADRFPQHYPSANAVDQRRRRARKRVRAMKTTEDRFIDILRETVGDAS